MKLGTKLLCGFTAVALIALVIGCAALMFALQKWCFAKTSLVERILLVVAAVLAAIFSINQNRGYFIVSAIIFGAVMLFQYRKLNSSLA